MIKWGVCVCNPATIPCGVSESQSSGVLTLDRDLSVPSLCSYRYIFYSSPPVPPVSTVFLNRSISLLHPTASPSVTVSCLTTSICYTPSPPPLPAQNTVNLYVVHTRHYPASSNWLCALRRVPASSAVSRVRSSPLFPPLSWSQVPVRLWRFLPFWVTLSPLCLRLALPVFCSDSWHLLVLGFLSGHHSRTRARGQGAYNPWK